MEPNFIESSFGTHFSICLLKKVKTSQVLPNKGIEVNIVENTYLKFIENRKILSKQTF